MYQYCYSHIGKGIGRHTILILLPIAETHALLNSHLVRGSECTLHHPLTRTIHPTPAILPSNRTQILIPTRPRSKADGIATALCRSAIRSVCDGITAWQLGELAVDFFVDGGGDFARAHFGVGEEGEGRAGVDVAVGEAGVDYGLEDGGGPAWWEDCLLATVL